jgi:hypothetical protein
MPKLIDPMRNHWLVAMGYKHRYTRLVFDGLEVALQAVEKDYEQSRDPDPCDSNEEAAHILGLGLVAVQNYMGEVALIARDMRKTNPSLPKIALLDLARMCGNPIPKTAIKDMEAIWHLANMWKHADEWDSDWNEEAKKNDRSKATIGVLTQLRIYRVTEHPVLEGIETALQVDWWKALPPLLARVSEWRLDALRACGCLIEV